MERREGFSLVELLVTLVLMSLVFLLLFRGFESLSSAVRRGSRSMEMDRGLNTALGVLGEDLEQMIVSSRRPFSVRTDPGEAEVRVFSFLRMRHGSSERADTEWVQYWVEAHAEEGELRRLVRYGQPAAEQRLWGMDAEAARAEMPEDLRGEVAGEVIVDELIELRFRVWKEEEGGVGEAFRSTEAGEAVYARRPAVVDLMVAMTRAPIPPMERFASTVLRRLHQMDGVWGRSRVRPRLRVFPELSGDEGVEI